MRATWSKLERYLRDFMKTLAEQRRAILVISGHWEEDVPTVNAGAHPPLLFDYGGFPDYTSRLTWPALGTPELAARARDLLSDAGIASGTERTGGWDHGIFVPLKMMVPGGRHPAGAALVAARARSGRPPRDRTCAEAAARRGRADPRQRSDLPQHEWLLRRGAVDEQAEAFDAWLRAAMIDGATRDEALIRWEEAPHARVAQPYEDHLLPLMVAAGAVHFHGHALGKPISGFRFG